MRVDGTVSRGPIIRVNFTFWPRGGGNLSVEEVKFFEDFKDKDIRRKRNVAYIIFQEEIAPNPAPGTSGVHIQGFFKLYKKKRVRGPTWKKNENGQNAFFWNRVNYSPADYVAASRAYASKVDTRRQDGIHGEHGITPRDCVDTVDDLIAEIQSGVSLEDVRTGHPKVMFHHRSKVHDMILNEKPLKDTSGEPGKFIFDIFVGLPGSGKTRTAKFWKLSRGNDFYCVPSKEGTNIWMEGYIGQDRMIFNEMDDSWYTYQKIKKLCDGEESFDFPRKGYTMPSRTNTLIFTTNKDPTTWYPNVPDRSAFERRVNQYCHIYDFELTCTCALPFECTCGSHHSIKRRRYGPEGFKCGTRSNELEPVLVIDLEGHEHIPGHQSQQWSEIQQNEQIIRDDHDDLLTNLGRIIGPSIPDDDDVLEDEPDFQAIPPVPVLHGELLDQDDVELFGED